MSVIKSKDEKLESVVSGSLQGAITLEVEGLKSGESNEMASPNERRMEISKKIAMKGRPTIVKELFETGSLEGYPVFYNGGKRVFVSLTILCRLLFKIHLTQSWTRKLDEISFPLWFMGGISGAKTLVECIV